MRSVHRSSRSLALAPLLAWALAAVPVHAQTRPFVFSVTTATDTSKPQVQVNVDVGVGEGDFHGSTADRPDQRVGLQASFGRWTFVGNVGLSSVGSSYQSWQQGEVLYSFVGQKAHGFTLAGGGGLLHEPGGADVAVARLVAGRESERWRLHGNAVLQRPLASNRDALDVITTVGWAWRLTRSVAIGAEAIGEDLEGFWEPDEAEGGARLLVGPSLHIAPRSHRWQILVAGGPSFHPSDTGRSSSAVRELPPSRTAGYAVRTAFSCVF
jgi:hypothetical protein